MKLGHKIALNSSAQAARQVVAAGTGILGVALVTRYLSVDQYGAVLAALVLISLFSFATDLGISAMTVRAMARDPENEVAISSSAFWVWTAFGAPTAISILILSFIVYPGPSGETTRTSVLILMSTFPLLPFSGVAGVRAVAEQRVWVVSVASIFARVGALIAMVAAVVLDTGPTGVAVAFACGYIFEQLSSIIVMHPRIEFRRGLHRARIWSLVAAAMPLGLVMVINGLYFRLDAFLLSLLGSKGDLAVYGVAYKAFESFLQLPGFAMVTLMPVLAKLSFGDERFRELVGKAMMAMVVAALPIAGLSVMGSDLMVTLAGEKYAEGGLVLSLIMIGVAFSCVQWVFGNTIVTQGKQTVLLKVSILNLFLNGVFNVIAIPLFGDRGAAGALLLTEIVSLGNTLWVYSKLAPVPHVEKPGRLLLALAGMVVVALAATLIGPSIVAVIVGAGVGVPTYLAILIYSGALPAYLRSPFEAALRSLRPKSAV
jgi:O-antigen/teichoic acid export membrane protein